MKLIISSPGDMTVGIFPETWTLDCPFDMDAETEVLDEFKAQQEAIYKEFSDDASAEYDFEAEERQRMEDEADPDFGTLWDQYQRFQEESAKRGQKPGRLSVQIRSVPQPISNGLAPCIAYLGLMVSEFAP